MPHKRRIMYDFVRISTKALTRRFFKNKTAQERIGRFTVSAFDYDAIAFLFGEIFFRGEYFFQARNSSPVILDCGANIGMATLFFKSLYPECIVYAFEPDIEAFGMLERNVKANDLKDVFVFNCALTDKNGTIEFYSSQDNPGSLHMSVHSARINGRKRVVNTLSLASFIKERALQAVDFAKIDIEGAEDAVIADLAQTQSLTKIREFALEYHHKISGQPSKLSGILRTLETAGFEYQIDTQVTPISGQDKFQDIVIRGYRSAVADAV